MEDLSDIWMCNYVDNLTVENESHPNLVEIWKCNWNHFMTLPLTAKLFSNLSNDIQFNHLEKESTDLLAIAISSLQLFVQQNFIGPYMDNSAPGPNDVISSTEFRSQLQINGIDLNVNVEKSEWLLLSKKIIEHLMHASPTSYILQWWYLRLLYIYNEVLDEPSHSLYTEFTVHSENLLKQLDDLSSSETKALLLLEISQQFLSYKRVQKVQQHLEMVRNLLETNFEVKGVLGVRTKYQQKALPQLSLKIEGNFEKLTSNVVTHSETLLPKLLKHDDDTRLEKILFQSDEENTVTEIPSLIQLLVLATVQYIQKSQPKDRLANEELEPYLTTLLYQTHGPWTSRLTTLMMNLHLESSHKRTVDRSLRQCEEISNLIKSTHIPLCQRLSFAYASFIHPRWSVQIQLGDLMLSLGLVKSALECYLKIKNWEEVIVCYTILDLRHKAAEIIRQEIDKKPTVELYCLLGDATDDPAFYEKAWKMSNEKSGRAQRHWGGFYFARKDYEKAIPHLQKSLELNSLQETVWARLGFAALTLENWELAANAYRMYTNIEPNGFESWNNLAKAYINLGDKKRAHKVLHEAIKCNFNNWKVWENFLYVSVDTGNFEDALNAYNQLIEIKGKYYDKELLEILVKTIVDDIPDADGQSTQRLKKKTQTLLGHLCVQLPSEGVLWEYSATLCAGEPLARAQKLQKAFRCYTQIHSMAWSKNPVSSIKVLEICRDLCEASLAGFADHKSNERSIALSQLSSARLSAQGSIRAVNDQDWDNCEQLIPIINQLLENIKDVLLKNL